MKTNTRPASFVKLVVFLTCASILSVASQAADKPKPKPRSSLAEQVAASVARARLKCPEAFKPGTVMQSAMHDVAFHYDQTKPGWREKGDYPEQLIEIITHSSPNPEWHTERILAGMKAEQDKIDAKMKAAAPAEKAQVERRLAQMKEEEKNYPTYYWNPAAEAAYATQQAAQVASYADWLARVGSQEPPGQASTEDQTGAPKVAVQPPPASSGVKESGAPISPAKFSTGVEITRQKLDFPLVKEVVTTLKQHEAFFAELRQFETLAADVAQSYKRTKTLEAEKTSIPGKGEFETTAEYHERIRTTKARIETGQRQAAADAATFGAKSLVVSNAIREKQAGLDGLVTRLKVKMGPYDADNQKISLFTPEPYVFGSYNERTAIATAKEAMPAYSCSADIARRLREASEKGELYCTVQFESPKLKLAHAPFALPATGGDKWGEALGKLGLVIIVNAFDPSRVNQVSTNISDTKTHDANTIQIEGYSSLQFLNFFNKSGTILAQ